MRKIKVGVVGCGNISGIYFKNLSQLFDNVEVVACADLIREKAVAKAEEFGVPKVCTTEELLADPQIEIVLNLTIPIAHASVCLAALEAGKHVHVEKPLAITREDGEKILKTAKAKGLLVGCAPDTFLGGGIQTCRKLIDDGWIGEPVAANAFMMGHGHESWHPDPEFYYKAGGGPMFDMGPYYLTALINLMGPVKRVTGSARITFTERTITSQPKKGSKISVDVPTHISGVMDFESGAVGTIITSFDVWGARLPNIEVHGTKASLSVPNPNIFGGPVEIKMAGSKEWEQVPLTHGYIDNARGIGVYDMANVIQNGGELRASGELAYHVLEVMHGFHDASKDGIHYVMKSTCKRPEALQI